MDKNGVLIKVGAALLSIGSLLAIYALRPLKLPDFAQKFTLTQGTRHPFLTKKENEFVEFFEENPVKKDSTKRIPKLTKQELFSLIFKFCNQGPLYWEFRILNESLNENDQISFSRFVTCYNFLKKYKEYYFDFHQKFPFKDTLQRINEEQKKNNGQPLLDQNFIRIFSEDLEKSSKEFNVILRAKCRTDPFLTSIYHEHYKATLSINTNPTIWCLVAILTLFSSPEKEKGKKPTIQMCIDAIEKKYKPASLMGLNSNASKDKRGFTFKARSILNELAKISKNEICFVSIENCFIENLVLQEENQLSDEEYSKALQYFKIFFSLLDPRRPVKPA